MNEPNLLTSCLLSTVLCIGCVTGSEDEPDLSVDQSDVVGTNKLALNKLALNKLALNKLALNKLALNGLNTQNMMATADGRDVMSYVVGCALPTGQSITAQDSAGVSYTFPGWLNLAPAWATRAPTVTERRWVTSCLLARTNLYGKQVSISMRSPTNVTLTSSSLERTQYTNAEGAFYGDLFASPQTWYACSNRAWVPAAPDSLRMCALSSNGFTTDCGFTYAGACTSACTTKTAPFGSCKGGTTTYAEVITIFLTPTQQQGQLQ